MNESSIENETLETSKSQRKRDAHELLDLAKRLIAMPDIRLNDLPLDQDIREEVEFARGINARGARKRQLMTVGKMLRQRDTHDLVDAVNNIDQNTRQINIRFHHIEAWRDKLIEANDQELAILLEKCPGINVQTLRQLIRKAKKETKLGKPPAAARKLFRLLRESDEQANLPPLN